MEYRSPEWLFALLLLPVLVLFFWAAARSRKRALARFGEPALMARLSSAAPGSRARLKGLLLLGAFLCIVVALGRPLFGAKQEIMKRKGVDIVIALDVSNSMLAEDIKPDRIRRAKYEITRLLDRIKADRVGLVAFAGAAFVQCPVTTDYGAVRTFLDVLDPAAIPAQGTDITGAIEKSARCFNRNENKYKVLVLITDGEDNEGDVVAAAKKAREEGVVIFALGIGSKGGVPIPLDKRSGSIVYKKDRDGNTVLTTLNEETLESVADATGGRYFHSTGGALELDRIYGEISRIEKKELKAEEFNRLQEQFMWPLALGLLLLAAEFFVPARRRKNRAEGRFEE
ncbi:MAG: VWA domain-containing protein [Fibrobacterota bacterium]